MAYGPKLKVLSKLQEGAVLLVTTLKEAIVRKTYTTPTLVTSGDVSNETKGGSNNVIDGPGLGAAPGSVGFYL